MCVSNLRSDWSVTPRYLLCSVTQYNTIHVVIWDYTLLVKCYNNVALLGLKLIPHIWDHWLRKLRFLWKSNSLSLLSFTDWLVHKSVICKEAYRGVNIIRQITDMHREEHRAKHWLLSHTRLFYSNLLVLVAYLTHHHWWFIWLVPLVLAHWLNCVSINNLLSKSNNNNNNKVKYTVMKILAKQFAEHSYLNGI